MESPDVEVNVAGIFEYVGAIVEKGFVKAVPKYNGELLLVQLPAPRVESVFEL